MELENFYVLMIVNHETREYNVRVEPERGDVGSIHSLTCYIAVMAKQCTKHQLGHVKEHWMMPFWRRVIENSESCEQMFLARISAVDVKDARAIWRASHSDAFKRWYHGMGYTSFYPQNAKTPAAGEAVEEAI